VELCLAVDIGGTKLATALVSAEGEVVAQQRAPTPRTDDRDVLFGALAGIVRAMLDALPGSADDLKVCGVGCGGPMSRPAGTVSPLNIPAWREFPLAKRLAELTELPVHLDNDAKALALGEGWKGAARSTPDFLAMVVSTGVGGGIVLDGRLVDGATFNAGHVGHVIVEPEGRRCGCGARGCLEAEASGTAIRAMTGKAPEAASGQLVERSGKLVGRAVATVCNLLDLSLVVVAGSVALGFGDPFFAAANSELHDRARLSFSSSARVLPAGLGSLGPLVGAAAVGWRGTGVDVLGSSR
jgi:glucokinase